MKPAADSKNYWLDEPRNVTRLFRGLWICCALLLSIDLIVHRHEVFAFASSFGFHGIFGFSACVALVVVAKQLRRVLKRDEDYYDR